jgi:hypothetical protein
MVFKTWFSGLGISTLGPGFSHRGFRVAFGHGHPLVVLDDNVSPNVSLVGMGKGGTSLEVSWCREHCSVTKKRRAKHVSKPLW